MFLDAYKRRIAVASGKEPADTVITNGKIIDVFNGEIIEGDIAIADGLIVGIGAYSGRAVVDAGGKYVAPAFIDGHVHIESSMLTPAEFAKVLLPHGVTSIVADPHEVANATSWAPRGYSTCWTPRKAFRLIFTLCCHRACRQRISSMRGRGWRSRIWPLFTGIRE